MYISTLEWVNGKQDSFSDNVGKHSADLLPVDKTHDNYHKNTFHLQN